VAAERLSNHRERPASDVKFGCLLDLSLCQASSTHLDAAVSEKFAGGALAEPVLVGQEGCGRAGEVGRYDLLDRIAAKPIGSSPWSSLLNGLPC
jgi:hypothetical protein